MESKLRQASIAKNPSQRALANMAGAHQPQIVSLEKGFRKLTGSRTSKPVPHLGVDASELVDAPAVNGNRIRDLRKAGGLTQNALATLVGTDKSQIRRLESGERRLTLDWMRRIAGALHVDMNELHAESPARLDEMQLRKRVGDLGIALNKLFEAATAAYDSYDELSDFLNQSSFENQAGAETLGQRLRRLREEAGISSQEKAAEILGVSRAAVTQWETGATNPELGRLSSIAAAYSVDLNTLLDGLLASEDDTAAPAPPSLDADGIRAWVKEICAEHNVTPSAWARKAHLYPGTVTRFLNDVDAKHRLSATTIDKLQAEITDLGKNSRRQK